MGITCILVAVLALKAAIAIALVPSQHTGHRWSSYKILVKTNSALFETRDETRRTILKQISVSTLTWTSIAAQGKAFAAGIESDTDVEGISAITQSELGKSIRYGTVKGAQIIDKLDEGWERFSDSLRDKNKCDPVTNRRLFDNGVRRDGTRVGDPVLGALCDPVPLRAFDDSLAQTLRALGDQTALQELGVEQETLNLMKQQVRDLVGPSFTRAQNKPSSHVGSEQTDALKRQNFNFNLYCDIRAYSQIKEKQGASRTEMRRFAKSFETAWGKKLRTSLAPFATKKDFRTPLPMQLPDYEHQGILNYDAYTMLNSLGVLSASLEKLQAGGIVGQWEIIIPDDNDGEVVTVAVDDDTTIPCQVLLQEQGKPLSGSIVTALARAVLEESQISYTLESYFIDPTTTRQEEYNPTQLLLNLRELGN